MKKIDWVKVWTFIKSRVFTILIIIALIIFSSMQCSRIKELKIQKDISDQNIIALNDKLNYEKTKNGELLVTIAGYIATEKELKTLNKGLWDKIREQDGKVISLNAVIVQLKQDSAMLAKYLVEKDKVIEKLLKIDDNTYAAPWRLKYSYDSTNYDVFYGKTYIGVLNKDPLELAHVNTDLLKRETQIDLVWGQKVEKGQLRIFIQSNYPGFTVAQMEGVLINPSDWPDIFKPPKRHWFQGLSLGVGITGGWNFMTQKTSVVFGPSLIYSIYTW